MSAIVAACDRDNTNAAIRHDVQQFGANATATPGTARTNQTGLVAAMSAVSTADVLVPIEAERPATMRLVLAQCSSPAPITSASAKSMTETSTRMPRSVNLCRYRLPTYAPANPLRHAAATNQIVRASVSTL